ncbi:hypothetical protein UA08_06889 [Talaromyces atroroseus]|uniref:Uncharacterized protein n=1 Tax=Talaromyces atroroseus TaxID=1441469 RepID=A0A225ASV0_TALAT|nr:hypothetical protein UA08_06889 [Talaromyces atroroseus]OKL57495.1 hypothetical protein UA08_06889 [Talaromyces atroroseus]
MTAIIGFGCRFAGSSTSPSRLWELLQHPRDIASTVPPDRFNADAFYHPDSAHIGTTNTREAYFIDGDVRAFDAAFFNISPNEARAMDPQHRLLLETVYDSLDAAGLRINSLAGSDTAIFCGSMSEDYSAIINLDPDTMPQYKALGTGNSMMANRISYFFDWNGPSVVVDTACSSSLVALQMAADALQKGQCSLAVAAASNLILSPHTFVAASTLQMLSPTGRCHMWDSQADGFARGEGIASIVLKRLPDAIRDGDPIECVVRSIGINSDGRGKGLSIPNSLAQEKLILSTYLSAGLDPSRPEDRCQFFEAHGTGTQAGDAEEASAIYNAFFQNSSSTVEEDPENFIYVGSIKTIIGHTEATAGLASVIKSSLCLQHGLIVPNLHFHQINTNISSYLSRLRVPTKTLPWPKLALGVPRRISVNSFGLGGTNAHVILESFDSNQHSDNVCSPILQHVPLPALPFIFSARSEQSLVAVLKQYHQYIQQNRHVSLVDLAATLFMCKSKLKHRAIISAFSTEDLLNKISARLDSPETDLVDLTIQPGPRKPRCAVGIFTGQGAQWPQMGLNLLSSIPDAYIVLQKLQDSLNQLPLQYRPTFSMIDELSAPESSSRVHEAAISLSIRTALQIIQVDILRAVGISLDVVIGHSSGEIPAAYAAGILTSSDAIRIAYLRGHIISKHQSVGGMVAVDLSWDQANAICSDPAFLGKINIGAYNSPSNVTLSGDSDAIDELNWLLQSLNQNPRVLRVDTAYHSHHMLLSAEPYLRALEECNIHINHSSSIAWYSSVFGGDKIDVSLQSIFLKGEYWMENMLRPVMFCQAVASAFKANPHIDVVLEVGPNPTLKIPSVEIISSVLQSDVQIPYIGLAERNESSTQSFARAIGLYAALSDTEAIDIKSYIALFKEQIQPNFLKGLPLYPFDHTQSYSVESRMVNAYLHRNLPPNSLLGNLTSDSHRGEWRWRNHINTEDLAWLEGHRVQSNIVFPAAGYISMVVEAIEIIYGRDRSLHSIEIDDFAIDRAIIVPVDRVKGVETLFRIAAQDSTDHVVHGNFSCVASFGGILKPCVSGRVIIEFGELRPDLLPRKDDGEDEMRPVNTEEFYDYQNDFGLEYSGPFRSITYLERKKDVACGFVSNCVDEQLHIHPATLDAALHSLLAAASSPGDGQQHTLNIPVGISRITLNPTLWGPIREEKFIFQAFITELGPTKLRGDVHLFDTQGQGLLSVEDIILHPIVETTPTDNDMIFSTIVWGPLKPTSCLLDRSQARLNIDWEILESRALSYIRDINTKLDQHLEFQGSQVHTLMKGILMQNCELPCVCFDGKLDDTANSPHTEHTNSDTRVELEIIDEIGNNLLSHVLNDDDAIQQKSQSHTMVRSLYCKSEYFISLIDELAGLVKQIVFRFPSLRILELGAGSECFAGHVIKKINGSYYSYTYTALSDAFFHDVQSTLREEKGRVFYKVLDVESDLVDQDYGHYFYDLVIDTRGSFQKAKNRKQALKGIRNLLKPGGYFVGLQVSKLDSIWALLMSCACGEFSLSSAQHGEDHFDDAVMGSDEWERAAIDAGFDTFGSTESSHGRNSGPMHTILWRASDEHLRLLENSLSSGRIEDNDLIVVGGTTTQIYPVVLSLIQKLRPYFLRIIHAADIESLKIQNGVTANFILLIDVEEPIFQSFTNDKLVRFQQIMTVARTLLWVAPNHDSENPYLGMSKGFFRSLVFEYPLSRIQYLQIQRLEYVTTSSIFDILMRLVRTNIQNEYKLPQGVDNHELELMLDSKGVIMIPRLQRSNPPNQRYLASRYVLDDSQVSLRDSIVDVIVSNTVRDNVPQFQLLHTNHWQTKYEATQSSNYIEADYSTLQALPVDGGGFLHLMIGQDAEKNTVAAFCSQHASLVGSKELWSQKKLEFDFSTISKPMFIEVVAQALLAFNIISKTNPGMTILVHEPKIVGTEFQRILSIIGEEKGIHVYFSVSEQVEAENTAHTIFIHAKSSLRQLSKQLPTDIALIIQLSDRHSTLLSRIKSLLPLEVIHLKSTDICRSTSALSNDMNMPLLERLLNSAIEFAKSYRSTSKSTDITNIQYLPNMSFSDLSKLEILDWTDAAAVPVRTRQASSLIRLSAHKTYLLVGMTGDLGKSLAEWMICRGARNIVLASRSPKRSSRWTRKMTALGARVVFMQMDVSDRESVLCVHNILEQLLPPVGGVVNGAMILRDNLFSNLTLESMQDVWRPKVQGSIILSDLYRDPDLEFFILIGSMAGPVGNPSQTAYGAAAEFMASLIRQRREIFNLPGSVIHPGAIIGLGYLGHTGQQVKRALINRWGPSHLSERDFHELFAEGILAGKIDSACSPEVIAGLRRIHPKYYPDALCYAVPKMWPFIVYSAESTAIEDTMSSNSTLTSVKAQLQHASSQDRILGTITRSIINKLLRKLGLNAEKHQLSGRTYLTELGADSLVALDLRRWFHKELGVDISILEILSGVSIGDLVQSAASKLATG